MLSLPILLALVPMLGPASDASLPGQGLLVLERGRGVLLSGSAAAVREPLELVPGREREVQETGFLELGAGARARLRWRGLVSLALDGPAVLEWEPSEERGVEAGSLALTIERLAALELEVRHGRHTLHLPGDWRARVEGTAFHLQQLPARGFEIRVHAGREVALEWRGDPSRARPPVWARAGRTLRFDEPPVSRPDDRRAERAWSEPSWPWSRITEPAGAAARREHLTWVLRRHAQGPRPWPDPAPGGWGGTADTTTETIKPEALPQSSALPPWLRPPPSSSAHPDELAASLPAGPPAVDARSEAAPPRSAPDALPRVWLRPGEDPPVSAADYAADAWRGVPRERLSWAGPFVIDSAPGVEARLQSRGRIKVIVNATAPREVWCFGPKHDVRLEPGAVVVFHLDGTIRSRLGVVEEVPARPARPLAPLPARE